MDRSISLTARRTISFGLLDRRRCRSAREALVWRRRWPPSRRRLRLLFSLKRRPCRLFFVVASPFVAEVAQRPPKVIAGGIVNEEVFLILDAFSILKLP
ncbi:hypothetical protein LWI28_022743 [Acer negundo]|uniref:Uncharacterized protein n=1 Tax=Acer negundo TaxID=4023 RepID=A0AAD5IMR8_ACENE|nr:hypothetical protein LWI28_022743 [Acer negundo]